MIVLQLSGGLGNQMFQIAMAWRLASEGKQVTLDDATAYREMGEKARPLQLADAFGITYPKASREDISRLRDESPKLMDRVRRRLFGRKLREVRDRDFVYDASLLSLGEVYLAGTFQCPAYFTPIREKVRENFVFTKTAREASPAVQAMAERIQKAGNSCSVHLRFGDYLEKASVYGGICTKAYYEAALRRVLAARGGAVFFVFSNDEEKAASWIREEEAQFQSAGASFVLVTGNDENHGYLDLYLMTLTKDHVIANSSFSWWGAYLGEKPGSLVIAPSIWIHEPDGSELQRRDIYTKEMILLTPRGEDADELIGKEPGETPLVSVITACYN
ncbi:MAG: alpha-1,2-fucosyltransferase, partial [Lachnospiraceae bacterium]